MKDNNKIDNNRIEDKDIKTAIGYIRVSTNMQVDGYSLDGQERDIKKYCKYQEIKLKKVFRDEGISGSNMDKRDGLKEAIEYAKENSIDYLIVWKLSRLTRNMVDLVNILNKLEEENIAIYSIADGIDSSTQMGKSFIYMGGIFAEMELENIKTQVSNGMTELARKGGYNGGLPTVRV